MTVERLEAYEAWLKEGRQYFEMAAARERAMLPRPTEEFSADFGNWAFGWTTGWKDGIDTVRSLHSLLVASSPGINMPDPSFSEHPLEGKELIDE